VYAMAAEQARVVVPCGPFSLNSFPERLRHAGTVCHGPTQIAGRNVGDFFADMFSERHSRARAFHCGAAPSVLSCQRVINLFVIGRVRHVVPPGRTPAAQLDLAAAVETATLLGGGSFAAMITQWRCFSEYALAVRNHG
jgi:hypothetical protein